MRSVARHARFAGINAASKKAAWLVWDVRAAIRADGRAWSVLANGGSSSSRPKATRTMRWPAASV